MLALPLPLFQELRAAGADSNYLLYGKSRRARQIQNYGNAQAVVVHGHGSAAEGPGSAGKQSVVCTLL